VCLGWVGWVYWAKGVCFMRRSEGWEGRGLLRVIIIGEMVDDK
jgi:hypothetical protein